MERRTRTRAAVGGWGVTPGKFPLWLLGTNHGPTTVTKILYLLWMQNHIEAYEMGLFLVPSTLPVKMSLKLDTTDEQF